MLLSEFLENELNYRRLRNNGYSSRAFARDMGLSASFAAKLLKGTANLSALKSQEVASKLHLSPEKQELFLNIVKLSQSSDQKTTVELEEKIFQAKNFVYTIERIEEAQFRTISKWYVGAVIAKIKQANGKISTKKIAESFGVKAEDIAELLQDLLTIGLLKFENNQYIQSSPWYKVPDIPSFYIQRFHAAHLDQAKKALLHQPPSERYITGTTFLIQKDQQTLINDLIKEFHDKVSKIVFHNQSGDCIYHLATQFYKLDQ